MLANVVCDGPCDTVCMYAGLLRASAALGNENSAAESEKSAGVESNHWAVACRYLPATAPGQHGNAAVWQPARVNAQKKRVKGRCSTAVAGCQVY